MSIYSPQQLTTMGYVKKTSNADILEKGSVKSYIKAQKVLRKMYNLFNGTGDDEISRMRDRVLKMDESDLDEALECIAAEDRVGFKKLADSIKITNIHRVNMV